MVNNNNQKYKNMPNKKKIILGLSLVIGFSVVAVIVLLGCYSNRYIPDFSEQIEYDYKVTIYCCEGRSKEIAGFRYYNEKEQLLESVGYESRAKFFYNEKGQLVEKFYCRMYNCQAGYQDVFIYDENENHIETYKVIKEDTVKFKQIKFYDENNHLIKQFDYRGTHISGEPFEYWKHYTYENDKIIDEITMRNNDTVWVGKYSYDEVGNLISIYRQKGQKQQKEMFEYDQSGKLIKKSIEDNTYPLTKDVSHSATNHSTVFLYNEQGKLIEEIRYNHKGEIHLKYVYVYEYNDKQVK